MGGWGGWGGGAGGRIRGNCFPHSSRALSDAAEGHNAIRRLPDKPHANADNGLIAKGGGQVREGERRRTGASTRPAAGFVSFCSEFERHSGAYR